MSNLNAFTTFIADLVLSADDTLFNVTIESKSGKGTLTAMRENMANVEWVMDFHIVGNTAMIQVINNPSWSQVVPDIQNARFNK